MNDVGCPNCSTALTPEEIKPPVFVGDKVVRHYICNCCSLVFTWTASVEEDHKRRAPKR